MACRKAKPADVPAIRDIIEEHSMRNRMLARSLSYLYENLRDYYVAEEDGSLVGCVGLHISWGDLVEIKSLAVAEPFMGKGVGSKLLDCAIGEARELGMPRVFTLTLEPEFFKKHGFREIPRDELPMKIWGECIQCPKYPECDEVPLIYDL